MFLSISGAKYSVGQTHGGAFIRLVVRSFGRRIGYCVMRDGVPGRWRFSHSIWPITNPECQLSASSRDPGWLHTFSFFSPSLPVAAVGRVALCTYPHPHPHPHPVCARRPNRCFLKPQAIVLDVTHAVMYVTDTHVPSLLTGNMRDYNGEGVSSELWGSELRRTTRPSFGPERQDEQALLLLFPTHSSMLLPRERQRYNFSLNIHDPRSMQPNVSPFNPFNARARARSAHYSQLTTLLSGVIQQRQGPFDIEDYFQPLLDPQALQLDTRREDLGLLYISDYGTGYIYAVCMCVGAASRCRKGDKRGTGCTEKKCGVG